jgi:hypothetical protein
MNGALGSIELVTVLGRAIPRRDNNGNESIPSRSIESIAVAR